MLGKALLYILLLTLAGCASQPSQPAVSEDAPSGTWSGDYDVSGRRESISVDLRWEDAKLQGIVKSGFRSLPITEVAFDRDTGAIMIKFDAEGPGGRTVHYVVDGKVTGNTMTGTWSHDDQRGDFKVTKE